MPAMSSLLADTYSKKGMIYGLFGTLVMSLIMLVGMGTGISPIPEPIPMAIARELLGEVAQPVLMVFAIITHFGYGGIWGVVLYRLVREYGGIWHGLGWGVILWLIMELIVLPMLGWGVFGSAVSPKIAVATLLLHLIYGGILGWGLTRIPISKAEV